MEDIANNVSQLSYDISIDDEEPEEIYEGKSFTLIKQMLMEHSYVSVKPYSL